MTSDALRKQEILSVLAEESTLDPALLDADATISELGVSSLDMIELIFRIESRFGIEVPNEGPLQNTDVKVQDLVDYVLRLIDAKDGKAPAAGAGAPSAS